MRWFEESLNTKRIRKSFLLFPKRIKRETRWLEFAIWEEYYTGGGRFGWEVNRWMNKNEQTKNSS